MVSTYSEAGVDIDASEKATEALIAQIKNVGRKGDGEAIKLDNGFAGLVKLGDGALAMCTDGVGSKLLLAEEMDSLHTVGIDCVAMNTNDLICVGAEPLSFVDYVALDKPDEELMAKLAKELKKLVALEETRPRKERCWRFPPLEECRNHFEEKYGIKITEPG